jgi:hypothetical protein
MSLGLELSHIPLRTGVEENPPVVILLNCLIGGGSALSVNCLACETTDVLFRHAGLKFVCQPTC